MASLPKDLQDHTSLAKTANLEGLARSYIAAQQMIGGDPSKLVTMPELTDADAVKGMMHRLGLPKEQGESYDIKAVNPTPEWMAVDGDFAKAFSTKAFEAGLMPHAANRVYNHLIDTFQEMTKDGVAKANDVATKEVDTLKVTWGPAFDQNIQAALFAVEKLGGQPLAKAIQDSRMGTNPHLLEALAKVGKILGEETNKTLAGIDGTVNAFDQTATPAEEINKGRELLGQAMKSDNPAERLRLNKAAQDHFARAHPGTVPTA